LAITTHFAGFYDDDDDVDVGQLVTQTRSQSTKKQHQQHGDKFGFVDASTVTFFDIFILHFVLFSWLWLWLGLFSIRGSFFCFPFCHLAIML